MNDQRPAWREPMVWLVAALPLASIVAGLGLLFVAARSGSNDAVADRVQRTAQIQVADLGPDALAHRLELSAILRIDGDSIEVLPVSGPFRRDEALRIALHHPSMASADRDLLLAPSELGWRAPAAIPPAHDWNVELSPQDGSWRLQGRLPRGQRAAHLKSSITGGQA
jgi:hypothetical protein